MGNGKGRRWGAVAARILLGLIFTVFGYGYFFMKIPPFDTTTPLGQFAAGMKASGYFFPFLKGTEGTMGLLLLAGFRTPLVLLVLAPIMVNILLFHAFLEPSGLPIAVLNILLASYLAWFHWDKYKGLFQA